MYRGRADLAEPLARFRRPGQRRAERRRAAAPVRAGRCSAPLDRQARRLVIRGARDIGALTALSPLGAARRRHRAVAHARDAARDRPAVRRAARGRRASIRLLRRTLGNVLAAGVGELVSDSAVEAAGASLLSVLSRGRPGRGERPARRRARPRRDAALPAAAVRRGRAAEHQAAARRAVRVARRPPRRVERGLSMRQSPTLWRPVASLYDDRRAEEPPDGTAAPPPRPDRRRRARARRGARLGERAPVSGRRARSACRSPRSAPSSAIRTRSPTPGSPARSSGARAAAGRGRSPAGRRPSGCMSVMMRWFDALAPHRAVDRRDAAREAVSQPSAALGAADLRSVPADALVPRCRPDRQHRARRASSPRSGSPRSSWPALRVWLRDDSDRAASAPARICARRLAARRPLVRRGSPERPTCKFCRSTCRGINLADRLFASIDCPGRSQA